MSTAAGAIATGGDGQPAPSGSKASVLVGGTAKKMHKHLKPVKSGVEAVIAAHPGLRLFFGVQSAYSNQILHIRHHNMPGTGQRMGNGFIRACAEEGNRELAARVRPELAAAATPDMLEFLAMVLDFGTAEGALAPMQKETLMRMVSGCSLDAPPGG